MRFTGSRARRTLVAILASTALVATLGTAHAVPNGAVVQTGPGGGGGGCDGWENTDARTATGFKFSIELDNPYFFTSFSATTNPAGSLTATPVFDGGRLYRYDVVVTGISIANGDCIDYTTTATMDGGPACNVGSFSTQEFTYPSGPFNVKTGPDWKFEFIDIFVSRGLTHPQDFKFVNTDPSRTITLGAIDFFQAAVVGAAHSERDSFATHAGATLPPGDSLVVPLTVPLPRLAKSSAIFVRSSMTYTGTGGGSPVAFTVDHEEQLDPTDAPGTSTAGTVMLILALMAAGLFLLRRRGLLRSQS